MSVQVFIGYKDEDNEYHGFLGTLEAEEYTLLKRLSERCTSPGILPIGELKALSDIKDGLVRAWIKLYETSKELPETEKQGLEKVEKALGQAIEAFDAYREKAPQLDLLLSFCTIDAEYSENEESENFEYIHTPDEEVPLLKESIEYGAIEHITVSAELVNAIYEWIELDGRRLLHLASMMEDDKEAMKTEIEWWKDNIWYFEEEPDYDLTTMLFRALRNNEMKCIRTGKLVLSSVDWVKRIEVL